MRNEVIKSREFNAWNRQVELFAEYFLCHAKLPLNKKVSFLDVGCGTGASLRVIHGRYPLLELFGCDKEREHVEISRNLHGRYGKFFISDIMDISEPYDIAYVSNVLEHMQNWEEAVRKLLTVCSRLYLMMPFQEPVHMTAHQRTESDHVVSFQGNSFDTFKTSSVNITSRVIRTPYAWGHPWLREKVLSMTSRVKRQQFNKQRQLLVSLTHQQFSRDVLPESPFINPVISWCKFLKTAGSGAQ